MTCSHHCISDTVCILVDPGEYAMSAVFRCLDFRDTGILCCILLIHFAIFCNWHVLYLPFYGYGELRVVKSFEIFLHAKWSNFDNTQQNSIKFWEC